MFKTGVSRRRPSRLMPRILLSKAQPGQVLSRPVTTSAGVVLVQAGAELTPAILERLANFGVDTVVVHDAAAAAADDRPVAERVREIEARFAGHEQDDWMMTLKQIVVAQLARAETPDA
jgi:hypothetical protein